MKYTINLSEHNGPLIARWTIHPATHEQLMTQVIEFTKTYSPARRLSATQPAHEFNQTLRDIKVWVDAMRELNRYRQHGEAQEGSVFITEPSHIRTHGGILLVEWRKVEGE